MNLFKILSTIFLATQLIACGGGGGAAFGAFVGALSPSSTVNEAPVANAGITQNVTLGFVSGVSSKVVTLDGTGSTDPNNNPLTFAWTLTKPTGSASVLSNATDAKPTFTADVVGTYTAQLIVKDSGNLESKVPSVVTIVASISNSAPVAIAGSKQFVVFGASSTVTLDGTYSKDDDNDQLTYNWTLLQKPDKSTAILSSTISSRPTFNADLAGDYVAQLIVNDGKVNSAPTSVIVVAGAANVQPKANAGDDKNAIVNTIVSLDGTNSSDPNSDTLTYQWDWMSSPGQPVLTAPALSLAIPSRPTFTPTRTGTYVLTLTVSDGKLSSMPDAITITVTNVSGAF
jgi:chitinase